MGTLQMSRRAKGFRHLMGQSVQATTQNILANNSRKVGAHVELETQRYTIESTGKQGTRNVPVAVPNTLPMNPAKAQRIAASLHSKKN